MIVVSDDREGAMRAASVLVSVLLASTARAQPPGPAPSDARIWSPQGLGGETLVVVDARDVAGARVCDDVAYPHVLTVAVLGSGASASKPIEVTSTERFATGTLLDLDGPLGQCGPGYVHDVFGAGGAPECAASEDAGWVSGLMAAHPGGELVVVAVAEHAEPVWWCGVEHPYEATAVVVGRDAAAGPGRTTFHSALPYAPGTHLMLGDAVLACNGAYTQAVVDAWGACD